MATGGRITTFVPGSTADISRCIQVLSDTQGYILQKEKALNDEKECFSMEKERILLNLSCKEDIHEQRVQRDKEELEKERTEFEATKDTAARIGATEKQHIITLDVGGEKFFTDMRTLQGHEDSIFPRLVKEIEKRRLGVVFIDRDSKHFRFILNYMRQGEEVFRGTALRGKDAFDLEEMICDARYYKLKGFMALLCRHKIRLQQPTPTDFKKLFTEKYFRAPNPPAQRYETTRQLTFKAMNMKGIVFENVHFKHRVSFEGSILEGAKFRHCQFDAMILFSGADISNVTFDTCAKFQRDRFVMDGKLAENCGVTVNPPVKLKDFLINYER